MGLTIRQLQRMLSKSVKTPDTQLGSGLPELVKIAEVWAGVQYGQAAVKNGNIVNACTCQRCRQTKVDAVAAREFVDSLCRQYGPNTPVSTALRDLVSKQEPRSGGSSSGDSDDNEQSDDNQSESSSSSSSSSSQSTQSDPRAEEKAREAADAWREDEERRQRVAERDRRIAEAEAARKAAEAAEAAAKLAEAKKQMKAAKTGKHSLLGAKRSLKYARRATSFNATAMASAPSLEARKTLASANGRLRAVPAKLRRQMAELINRLVGSSGAAGGSVSPIPVYDSRKLVKRMLVKRPLPNALKEDVVTGRPVTLFLPDVSPSCSAQAQDACDIANAAGYAGVSGSDVLVLPHSNGCVSEHEDAYVPWFNGRPVNLRGADWERLFTQIIEGRSKYRIRVVVAVGDHDAADMYEQLAGLKSVMRLVWLHNDTGGASGVRINRSHVYHDWEPDRVRKTTLVWGCTNQYQMIRGLDLALR